MVGLHGAVHEVIYESGIDDVDDDEDGAEYKRDHGKMGYLMWLTLR